MTTKPVLYEMEPIGVAGALEAVATLYFCSDKCWAAYKTDLPIVAGEDAEYLDGTCCETCGNWIGR